MLVETCTTGSRLETSEESAEQVRELPPSTSNRDEVIVFRDQLVVKNLCLAMNARHCCLHSAARPAPPPLRLAPVTLAAEITQKECLCLSWTNDWKSKKESRVMAARCCENREFSARFWKSRGRSSQKENIKNARHGGLHDFPTVRFYDFKASLPWR